MDWSTPADLEAQVRKLWDRGRLLAVGEGSGAATFPLRLSMRRPDRRALSERFEEVRRWIRELEEGSKARRGFGYEIEWTEIDHRVLGPNRVPERATVPTREDALRLVGRQRQFERFVKLAEATLDVRPDLRPWIEKRPMALLEHGDDWEKILAVVAWFRSRPRPSVYLRQIDVPGVDTKFIEARRGVLAELLDLVLEPEAVDLGAGARRSFEERYGLLSKPPLVRFRVLDPRHRIAGLSDLAVPAEQFAELRLPVARVFVTENEINGLAFPPVPDAIVLFGLGYALDRLAGVRWMHDTAIHYWGDVDTHGFAILDRLRATFPHARSLLMNRETLMAHEALWVQEESRHPGPLARLTHEEQELFESLACDRLGERVRLEQERIAFRYVEREVAAAAHRDGVRG